jgi:peroxiredoxin
VRGRGIVNVCQLWERGPVVLAFLATRGARCTAELDALDRARAGHPGMQFAAVSIRGDRAELRALVRRRGWRFPVAYDRDGILANLYGVAVCPQLTFALPGGRVTATSVGELDRVALERRLAALERAARAAGWRPPGR